MSAYGLIKIDSRIRRTDTINDLFVVNRWRITKGLNPVSSSGQSVRKLENTVALGVENQDTTDLPKLVRDVTFYVSILPEITDKERAQFKRLNP